MCSINHAAQTSELMSIIGGDNEFHQCKNKIFRENYPHKVFRTRCRVQIYQYQMNYKKLSENKLDHKM